jgi:hypothetical protein
MVAERVGFEPTVGFPLHTLSKRAPSTTRTSLRLESRAYEQPPKIMAHADDFRGVLGTRLHPAVCRARSWGGRGNCVRPLNVRRLTPKSSGRTRRECGASEMDLRSQSFFDSHLRLGYDPRRASGRQRMPPKERRETGRHRRTSLDVQQVAGALDGALLDLPEPGPQAIGHFDP